MANVLASRDLLRRITVYQDGIDQDLVALKHKKLLHCRRHFDVTLLTALYYDLVPWYQQTGDDGLGRLFAAMPCTRLSIAACAAHFGLLDIVDFLVYNYPNHYKPLMLEIAARVGRMEIVNYLLDYMQPGILMNTLWSIAIATNNLELTEVLFSWGPDYQPSVDQTASLDVITSLHLKNARFTENVMDSAAKAGDLAVVEFLHHYRTEGCTSNAMDDAATFGHLDVVKFLHDNRKEGCTNKAMNGAVRNGHLDVVRFLHVNRHIVCTQSTGLAALHRGHLPVLEYLIQSMNHPVTKYSLSNGVASGSLEVVKYLYSMGNHNVQPAIQEAIGMGRMDILEFLLKKTTKAPIVNDESIHLAICRGFGDKIISFIPTTYKVQPSAITEAATRGQFELLKFLFARNNFQCEPTTIDKAATHGHFEIVKYLTSFEQSKCTTAAMDGAASNGFLDIVQFLFENRTEGCTKKAWELAACQGHITIIKYLVQHIKFGATHRALVAGIERGHYEIVKCLLEHKLVSCMQKDVEFAYSNYHTRIAKLLENELRRSSC